MKTQEERRYAVYSRLLNGDTAKEISNVLDLGYATVLRYKTEFEEAKLQGSLDDILSLGNTEMLAMVGEVVSEAPSELSGTVEKAAAKLTDKLTKLDILRQDLEESAMMISKTIRSKSAQAELSVDLETLAKALCNLQTTFFNDSSVNVNVQNNYGNSSTSPYKTFLNDAPKLPENN